MPSESVQNMIPIIQQYLKTQPVERAYLFGSCSRGEETPDSDVDLLVTYTPNARISLLTVGGILHDLENLLQRPVDLVEEGYLKPFASASANRDKIKIYERAN